MSGFGLAFDLPARFLDDETSIEYDGRTFLVENGQPGHSHALSCSYETESEFRPAFRSANRFLNELAWFNRVPVTASVCVHGIGFPRTGDVSDFRRDELLFIHSFEQAIWDDRAHLALGLFREGFSANSPFYKFLSYFKIVEVAYPDGLERKTWVSEQIETLSESKTSVDRLKRAGISDVGDWLYNEGRNALAHGSGGDAGSVRDICDYDDWQDIVWANEIVDELARRILNTTFAVPNESAA